MRLAKKQNNIIDESAFVSSINVSFHGCGCQPLRLILVFEVLVPQKEPQEFLRVMVPHYSGDLMVRIY